MLLMGGRLRPRPARRATRADRPYPHAGDHHVPCIGEAQAAVRDLHRDPGGRRLLRSSSGNDDGTRATFARHRANLGAPHPPSTARRAVRVTSSSSTTSLCRDTPANGMPTGRVLRRMRIPRHPSRAPARRRYSSCLALDPPQLRPFDRRTVRQRWHHRARRVPYRRPGSSARRRRW